MKVCPHCGRDQPEGNICCKGIEGNLFWDEAADLCKAYGGYLATITTVEECSEISALVIQSGLTYLWIGGRLDSNSEWTWVTGEEWAFDNWYPGEPGGQDTDGTLEDCLCVWKAKLDGREIGWTFNDQRIDIIEAFPCVAGKVGFICEYEIKSKWKPSTLLDL